MENNRTAPGDPQESRPTGTHTGHRRRMRERYAENGFDGFSPHEVLEMLLYRSIPRGNTNPAAHALLDSCGSVENVLDGNVPVTGAAEKTLTMLRETGSALEELFRTALADAVIGRAQLYTAAVRSLRRHWDSLFVMIAGRNGRYQDMAVLPEAAPAEVLAELKCLLPPEQICHIACMAEPDSLRPLRRQYGRTILGHILCLTPDWEALWL